MIFITNKNMGIWSCRDVNTSGIKRITPSPFAMQLKRFRTLNMKFNNFDTTSLVFDDYKNRKQYKNVIFPAGVTHSPWDWTGYTDLNTKYDDLMLKRKTPFAFLDKKVLGSLRKNKAFLLLDQSHEGYHTDWLFGWFHDACKTYDINPARLIYVTGNLAVEDQYKEWCELNNVSERMCVIPHIHFEEFIWDSAQKQQNILPTFDEHISYKKEHANHIKTYNCFQKRARPHRVWMFYHLYKNGLLDDGINSMNMFTPNNSYYEGKLLDLEEYNELLPYIPMYPRPTLTDNLKKDFEGPLGGSFERDLYHQETRDSWVSVVSEASFAEHTCFISEKTFKPIAARHPFIMCGNKNSLKYLHELGYKTYNGFIDESYDTMDTWDRYDNIIKNIKTIQSMTSAQKFDWYDSMKDTIEHNYETLRDNCTTKLPSSVLKVNEYVS